MAETRREDSRYRGSKRVLHLPSCRRGLRAAFRLAGGTLLSLGFLELLLRVNPALLPHGIALPAPADPRLAVQEYDVRSSDADVFYWMPERIRPVPPTRDIVEARVRYETDEFGFPNQGPIPVRVDVVVLGRSYSLGAQAVRPWVRSLAADTGWRVLNLSQAGGGPDIKRAYLRRFGLPREPRWVVVEVLPSMDILGYREAPASMLQRLPVPIIQDLARRFRGRPQTAEAFYPLEISLPGRTRELVFFDYYVSAISPTRQQIQASRSWSAFREVTIETRDLVEGTGACMALLYAPTNAEIFIPLASDPSQLLPVVHDLPTWRLGSQGDLVLDRSRPASVAALQERATVARELIHDLADELGLVMIDPTDSMRALVEAGGTPFMSLDTHWSARGHALVASSVARALSGAGCP